MNRNAAINQLSLRQLNALSEAERKEILDGMLCEAWDEAKNWHHVPKELIAEWENQQWKDSSNATKYDALILVVLKDKLYPVTNAYLAEHLGVEKIIGEPDERFACPCCGRKTLDSLGEYDICPVCWWEDDGTDNDKYDRVSSPNSVALSTARYHFLNQEIYNPARTDLKCEPKDKYAIGRLFEIEDDHIVERGTDWSRRIKLS